jgi:leucyl-tRNA synthetase
MVLVNDLTKEEVRPRSVMEDLLLLLAPFAPHIAEELWKQLGHEKTLAYEPWPSFKQEFIFKGNVEIVVQINGKVRDRMVMPTDTPQDVVESTATHLPSYVEWTTGKTVRKRIYVPNKLINFVVG